MTVAVIAALALSGCTPRPEATPKPREDLALSIGTLSPITGALAAYGPAVSAAATLAAQDVNDADVGLTVTNEVRDAGDSSGDVGVTSATELIDSGVTAIIGAVSDGVSRKVVDQITGAGVLQISPGNNSPDFTRYVDDDLYWRTFAPCTFEGDAMGERLAADGVETIGVIYETKSCEPLVKALTAGFERDGGSVVATSAFDPGTASLSPQVAEVVAEKPDAVVVVTDDAAGLAVPDLVAAGYQGSSLYFVGLSLGDHSGDLPAGSIVGSIASMPGLDIASLKDFTDRLLEVDPAITDFSFAAETYDAVILASLAALAAGDTSGAAMASALQEVSGGSGGGEKATDFAAAAAIILAGGIVDYDGPSGEIAFDGNGDPTGAVVGFYRYGADNTFTRLN
jgi:branched-chain amino acid transport system substrate-binding protein